MPPSAVSGEPIRGGGDRGCAGHPALVPLALLGTDTARAEYKRENRQGEECPSHPHYLASETESVAESIRRVVLDSKSRFAGLTDSCLTCITTDSSPYRQSNSNR